MPGRWQLFLTFPNLIPPRPSPFETPELYLCAASDPRLRQLERNAANVTARRLLRRVWTVRGERYRPGCLLVHDGAPESVKTAEALRAFRNACSVASVCQAWKATLAVPAGGQWAAKWSDFFLFGYHVPGRDGSVINLNGIVQGLDDPEFLLRLRTQSSPQIGNPSHFSLRVDTGLLRRLLWAWRRTYVRRGCPVGC